MAVSDTPAAPHGGLAARLWRMGMGRPVWIALLVLVLLFLMVYPLGMLVYGSLHEGSPGTGGAFSLAGYAKALSADNAIVLVNTVALSLTKVVPSVAVALALAWIIARTDTPMRGLLEILITLPFFVPPILTAMAWALLGNAHTGPINMFWRSLTGSSQPLVDVYSFGGVVWHMAQYSVSFAFLILVEAFRRMDNSLEEASRMCGASRWRTFRSITLRLLLPVIVTCSVISFIRGMESLESPLFFGTPAGIRVAVTEIYNTINEDFVPDYQYATAFSMIIIGLMFLVLLVQWKLIGNASSYQTVSGKGFRPGVIRLGRWRWLTFGFCLLFFFITVVLPVGQLIVGSVFRYIGFYTWESLTLRHYTSVLTNDAIRSAARNTFALGFFGASGAMVLGSLVAYVSVRTRWKGRRVIDLMAWLPWIMPGIVLGVGYLWAFAYIPGPVTIYGTLWALLLPYVALCTPLANNTMSTAFYQLSVDLEEASRVHGANFIQTMSRILVALAWPSFAIGWVLCFFGLMRELSVSILLYSVGTEVLSVEMLKLWSSGKAEEVCVIGLFMILLVILFRVVQILLARRIAPALK
ncbi:MAG: ABC transporter permease [Qingshengfaniella sp.]